jgi:hypothetical protein
MKHPFARTAALVLLASSAALCAETLVLEDCQTAGISGFRAMWNTPVVAAPDGVRKIVDNVITNRGGQAPWSPAARANGTLPGALAFDALQRSLLVRFPGAAEALAAKLAAGFAITKAELVLPFADEELWPEGSSSGIPPGGGYDYRANWGVDGLYRAERPTWHARAWALRKPWQADPTNGPTWNAFINGAGYWARFGAQDERQDRFPAAFGPAPVNVEHPDGRLDVTASLNDPAFGASPGERLRRLADCGFLLKKWETYDHRFFTGCYEWATACGGRAIIIGRPRLAVTLEKGQAAKVALPPAADLAALRDELARTGKGGSPTALIPDDAGLKALAEAYRVKKPDWMPDWQWQRVRELFMAEGGPAALDEPFWFQFVPNYVKNRFRTRTRDASGRDTFSAPDARKVYETWIDDTLGQQPRGWHGFEGARSILPWQLYRDALPGPARDSFLMYWNEWLMPDRESAPIEAMYKADDVSGLLLHPMADQLAQKKGTDKGIRDTYWEKTKDWRGNKSFYRSGFNYVMSTMNFNHSAAMGALLGGAIIGSERAMADGRHGMEFWPLRTWSWFDGTTQESIDHYYFAITLTAQKMVADFGPTPFDRMVGRTILRKSIDELAGAYHPGLRRFIAGASRTAPEHLLCTQDGLYHIAHTLSRSGALRDLEAADADGKRTRHGMPVIGHEVAPDHIARQTLQGPWAPEWIADSFDNKPFPWQMTCTYKVWGGHMTNPFMKRTFLGTHYGLYSVNGQIGFVPVMAQWRRAPEQVTDMEQLGTMQMRFGVNDTRMANDAPGWIKTYGDQAALQHRGKLLVVASPWHHLGWEKGATNIQETIALFNYQPTATWSVVIDGKPVTSLPATAKAGQKIALHDGVTYIGITALPATDLGRDAEVVLREGTGQTYFETKTLKPALCIDSVLYRGKVPFDLADTSRLDRAYCGFAVEFADAGEYKDFDAFKKHLAATRVTLTEEPAKALVHATYLSGDDKLEQGVFTTHADQATLDTCFAYQRINGEPAYLPKGIDRDTPLAQQGVTGRLQKNGATLETAEGAMSYLQCDSRQRITAGDNPFSDPTPWKLTTPGGAVLEADGAAGMLRATIFEANGRVEIDYALADGQAGKPGLAKALLLSGLADPKVFLNGKPCSGLKPSTVGGKPGWAIPLPN